MIQGQTMIPSIIVPVTYCEIIGAIKSITNDNATVALERKFSEYIECDNVFLTYSGRTALYLLLKAYKLEKGDEVIMPAYGCESVARLIIDMGYKIRFVDVDKNTYNMSLKDLSEKISNNTKAVIALHMFGNSCDMKGIKELGDDYNAVVLEDSAQAIGAEYHGKKTGTIGDCGFFSFGTAKPMTTINGGIAVSNDEEIIKIVRKISEDFRISYSQKLKILTKLIAYSLIKNPVLYTPVYKFILNKRVTRRCALEKESIDLNDFKYAYTDIQAAIGLVQLSKLDKMNNARIKNATYLMKNLRDMKCIHLPENLYNTKPVFLRYPISIDGMNEKIRDELLQTMQISGFDTPVAYPNVLPRFFNLNSGNYPNTEELVNKTITLPVHPLIETKDLKKIVSILKTFIDKKF